MKRKEAHILEGFRIAFGTAPEDDPVPLSGSVIRHGRTETAGPQNGKTHGTDAPSLLQIDFLRINFGWNPDPAVLETQQIPVDKIIDVSGKLVMPGLIDMHVYFRDPGLEYKDDINTGSETAVAGGVTTCCPMANTNPVNDNAVGHLRLDTDDKIRVVTSARSDGGPEKRDVHGFDSHNRDPDALGRPQKIPHVVQFGFFYVFACTQIAIEDRKSVV